MQNELGASGTAGRVSAELSDLQALHGPLLRAYAGISQGTNRLNIARPYLLAHVREGSARLRSAYTAAAQSEERSEVHEWLKKRSDDLESFIKDLDASRRLGRLLGLAKTGWSVASAGFGAVAAWVVAPTAAAATLSGILIATINSCLCEVFVWSFRVFYVSLLTVGVGGFLIKRSTLCNWPPKGQRDDNTEKFQLNVYETEQKLLLKVDASRHGEIQWDVITWFLMAATLVVVRYVAPIISRHAEKEIVFGFELLYGAAAFAVVGIIMLLLSWRRPWGWRPMI
jgi:hypothetical protein